MSKDVSQNFRSNHQSVLENFAKFTGNTCDGVLFLKKAEDLQFRDFNKSVFLLNLQNF